MPGTIQKLESPWHLSKINTSPSPTSDVIILNYLLDLHILSPPLYPPEKISLFFKNSIQTVKIPSLSILPDNKLATAACSATASFS